MPDNETSSPQPILTPIEARILGCLMEKQRTTPDTYPLTLNALVLACNQKTSRHPVMDLEVREVGHAANVLRDRDLIQAGYSGRSERYDHKMISAYRLDRRQAAVMATLMLRGPQTAAELRANASRLAELPDLAALDYALRNLLQRDPPLVVELPRQPGRREVRYGHTLCGPIDLDDWPDTTETAATPRQERLAHLEEEVARLRADLDALWELTGFADHRKRP